MKVGILALQGDVREHADKLTTLEAKSVSVKFPQHLDDIDALIIPGGESTTISMLMKRYKLDEAIKEKYKLGMPIYGTCAGAILLAKSSKGKQLKLGLADMSVERNAYGRQLESFEAPLNIKYIGDFNGIFIRAPVIKRMHNGTEILCEHDNHPVMIKHNNLLITTFHPELTDDTRVHAYFLHMAEEYKKVRDMQKDIEKSD